ncbi:MAG: hypothetical protein NXI13_02790 [Proteobacteria bacterium]|nr:hypothetical protein [Pseudomonadota bacterium]
MEKSENTADPMSGKTEPEHPRPIDSASPNLKTKSENESIEAVKASSSSNQVTKEPTLAIHSVAKETGSKPPSSISDLNQNDVSNLAYKSLLQEAKQLSSYYLRHPSPDKDLPLQQLDDAISAATGKVAEGGCSTEYQILRKAYRAAAGRSFSAAGINGKTLEDSCMSAHILWILPITICALVLVIFPLLLLGRTVSLEMYTSEFAADLIWVLGVAAAFLWGSAGALTLLSIQLAVLVRNRQYEADIRRSPGVRAALGGILGCGTYALLEVWLPQIDITTEFFLNLGSFAIGLVAWSIFLLIQKGLGRLILLFETDTVPSSARAKSEK